MATMGLGLPHMGFGRASLTQKLARFRPVNVDHWVLSVTLATNFTALPTTEATTSAIPPVTVEFPVRGKYLVHAWE